MKEDFEKIKFVRKVKTRKEKILQSRRSMHARICGPVPVVNPFTAPACKNFRAEKCTANSIFDGPVSNLLSVQRILIEIL